MKATIEVDIRETGNPNRGYHDYTTTIRFSYPEGEDRGKWVAEKEEEIVYSITGKPSQWMWHDIKPSDEGRWEAHYGYDSGD